MDNTIRESRRTDTNAAAAARTPDRAAQRRLQMRRDARQWIAAQSAVPPFSVDQLFRMVDAMVQARGLRPANDGERKMLAMMLHNAAWQETVAAIPYEQRLLLLPQCLRTRSECPATMDALGLLCRECGHCRLGTLQNEAAALGYAVLIAEGTGAVTGLLKAGNLNAVIGAGCMAALEQSFRHIADEAVPALAVPLLRDGCDATDVDLEWLRECIRLRSDATVRAVTPVDTLRDTVRAWFAPDRLRSLLRPDDRHAPTVAVDWVAGAGKRWRPLLTAAVYDALQAETTAGDLERVRTVAVAAECFHKASLIHDDIEDHDESRDGVPSLHKQYGIPIALNAGDLLIGEGYRLLTLAPVDPAGRLRLISVAADGHRRLCLGQGEELRWRQQPYLPASKNIIDLFELKTAPAFEVAILFGAVAGGADPSTCEALTTFSRALGVAYQIRDDLLDIKDDAGTGRGWIERPTLLLGLLGERCAPAERDAILERMQAIHKKTSASIEISLAAMYARHDVAGVAETMQAEYRKRAVEALAPLRSTGLKSVLVRLLRRILPDA